MFGHWTTHGHIFFPERKIRLSGRHGAHSW
jgi:hypothetical protein